MGWARKLRWRLVENEDTSNAWAAPATAQLPIHEYFLAWEPLQRSMRSKSHGPAVKSAPSRMCAAINTSRSRKTGFRLLMRVRSLTFRNNFLKLGLSRANEFSFRSSCHRAFNNLQVAIYWWVCEPVDL